MKILARFYPLSDISRILCRLGDNTSVKITQYNLLVSSCISSPLVVIPNCSTWKDQVVSVRDNVSTAEFKYPMTYNISFDLLEGYVYFFHLTPQNVLIAYYRYVYNSYFYKFAYIPI